MAERKAWNSATNRTVLKKYWMIKLCVINTRCKDVNFQIIKQSGKLIICKKNPRNKENIYFKKWYNTNWNTCISVLVSDNSTQQFSKMGQSRVLIEQRHSICKFLNNPKHKQLKLQFKCFLHRVCLLLVKWVNTIQGRFVHYTTVL